MDKFKVGDKVYVPALGNLIYQIDKYTHADPASHPFLVENEDGDQAVFAENGRSRSGKGVPMVFHVTPENHAKLEAFYEGNFEKPPTKPTSREIIQAILDRGDRYATRWASGTHQNPDYSNAWVYIHLVSNDYYIDSRGTSWEYATPFDHTTGIEITELPT